MKIVILHLLYATIIVMTGFDETARRRLSKRLMALRPRASKRYRPHRQ